jgi:hypothetical protein
LAGSSGLLRVFPTVGFPVIQLNPLQQPLMAFGIVPNAGRYSALIFPSQEEQSLRLCMSRR